MIFVSPTRRFLIAAAISSPILAYHPIRTYLVDKTGTTQPNDKLRQLIDELTKEQNLKINDVEILVKDELDFKLYPNLFGKRVLIVPKYLEFNSLSDLSSNYVNSLLKKEYNVELSTKDDWFSEDGKKIISSFLMSDQAKKFLLARNLYSLKNEKIFSYYSLAILMIYFPFQFIKWQRDLVEHLKSKLNNRKPISIRAKGGAGTAFLLSQRNALLIFSISFVLYFGVVLYFALGLENSRNSDAYTLSNGIAGAMMIKSKTSLMDFNYYSAGEEAYRKLSERNHSINRLFFNDVDDSNLTRWFNKVPLTKDGNPFNLFGNQVPIQTAYKNLNDWERNSV